MTFSVQAEWLTGIGCPTDAHIANFPTGTTPYEDPACPTGDATDQKNEGLLLAKTGPTANFASAVADINGVEGKTLTKLGYDIRKPGPTILDPRGSHCGAGAPRFNIETTQDFYFLGCASPPPDGQQDGDAFIRLTGVAACSRLRPTAQRQACNINVNGVRVGQGPGDEGEDDEGEDDGDGPRPCDRCDDD